MRRLAVMTHRSLLRLFAVRRPCLLGLGGALLLCALFATSALAQTTATGAHSPTQLVRIGTTNASLSSEEQRAVAETFLYLSKALPQYRFEIRNYPVANLETALKTGEMDLFLASSGFYRRVFHRGLRDLVTMTNEEAPNPSYASGSLFLVRKDAPWQSLEDLRGQAAAVSWGEGFTGLFIPQLELLRSGHDPEHFFSGWIPAGSPMRRLLESLERGEAEVAFARACTWEELLRDDPSFAARFRPIHLKPEDPSGFACLRSTDLFPNWTIVSTSLAPWQVSRDITVALLGMPPTATGHAWGVVSDFAQVDDLYRDLKAGPYAYLRIRSLSDVLKTYWPALMAALLIVVGLILHGWRSEVLVRKRTQELQSAMESERRTRAEAETERREKAALEQVSVIGAMSSLITHELNAPLNAISNCTRSLERLFENDQPSPIVTRSVALIRTECDRAADIVRHVRSYAKQRNIIRMPVCVSSVVADVVRDPSLKHPTVKLTAHLPEDTVFWMSGEPLEMELALTNLIKNAVDAVSEEASPEIAVRLTADDRQLQLSVLDNATKRPVVDNLFEARRMESTKPHGLGLGLLIVRTIVERAAGHVASSWHDPGLLVTITLPRLPAPSSDDQPETES